MVRKRTLPVSVAFLFLFSCFLQAQTRPAQARSPVRGQRPGPPSIADGIVTHVPSAAGGETGIAVRVVFPEKPRYAEGSPVVVGVAGGHDAGNVGGRLGAVECGFIEVHFAFPGGGQGDARSGGVYDHRGPNCILALRDVVLFAMGRTSDRSGRKIEALSDGIKPLATNAGIYGSSHGGNACGAVMGLYGEDLKGLAFYGSWESPYGEGAVGAELGSRNQSLNPAYDPKTGRLDLSRLQFDAGLKILPAGRGRVGANRFPDLNGGLYFDMDQDRRSSGENDYVLNPPIFDVGHGPQAWYSVRILREAEDRSLYGGSRPQHIPSLEEASQFWRFRDATGLVGQAVQSLPELAVIVTASETDHVQIAPDHPHISAQINAFESAGARFVRLNCDRAYVEWIMQEKNSRVPDNAAGLRYGPETIGDALSPDNAAPRQVLIQAALCELADRVQAKTFTADLDAVLFPDSPHQDLPGNIRRPRPGLSERQGDGLGRRPQPGQPVRRQP